MQQCICESHALSKSLGQVPDRFALHAAQPAAIHHVVDALPPRSTAELAQTGAKIEVLTDLHLGVERHILRQVTEMTAYLERLTKDVKTVNSRRAAGGRDVAAEHLHRG